MANVLHAIAMEASYQRLREVVTNITREEYVAVYVTAKIRNLWSQNQRILGNEAR